jgi:alpha-L-rhamnosidase
MKTFMKSLAVSSVFAIVLLCGCGAQIRDLRCEYLTHPTGIDTPRPELFWKMETSNARGQRQTAYQVLVASDETLLKSNQADMWDSGKVLSSDSVHIAYAGKPLASDRTYYWKVRCWDKDGKPGSWSESASWSMGLLDESDWKAQWIGPDKKADSPYPLPIFRHDFAVQKPVQKATVYISGLGHYDLFLNGQKVGDQFLAQPWTMYEKTVCYDTYDITAQLSKNNCFGVMLGKGFYSYSKQTDRRVHGVNINRPLKLRLQASIEYKDGTRETVISDTSWKTTDGPITHSAINGGEDFDARKLHANWNKPGFADLSWTPAVATISPAEKIIASPGRPMKMFDVLKSVHIDEPKAGHFVYNFGQNASAIPRICVTGQAGQKIRFTPAEQRKGQTDNANNGTGLVDQAGVGKPNYWEYTLRGGDEEIWSPQFTYSGYQYIELTGGIPHGYPNPDGLPVVRELTSIHVHTDVPQTGQFECSNELFNKTDKLIDWAVRSNMAHVMTDCPHREKLGWLEESYLMGPSLMGKYDMARFFNKIAMDIRNSQDADGCIYTVAPNYPAFDGGFRYSPEWGAAGILIPWQTYLWYGDKRCLENNYSMMKRYVDYMEATSKDLIAKPGLGDWYDYEVGKEPGPSRFTPLELTGTVIFYMCTQAVSKTADILGNGTDAQHYAQLAQRIKTQYNATYFDGTDTYQNKGSCQTANGMSLTAGLVPPQYQEAVLNKIVQEIRSRGNQQTAGDIGYTYLLTALREMGRSDVIFDMANRTNIGSYGGILAKGWTSMPEAWDARLGSSMNHFMLGHIQQWFYQSLAGIAPDPTDPGFKKIVIKPEVVGDLTWCRGHYESLYGTIQSEWKIKNGFFTLDLIVPANTTATVYIPAQIQTDVFEGKQPATNTAGVRFLRMEKRKAVFAVESGHYHLRTSWPADIKLPD